MVVVSRCVGALALFLSACSADNAGLQTVCCLTQNAPPHTLPRPHSARPEASCSTHRNGAAASTCCSPITTPARDLPWQVETVDVDSVHSKLPTACDPYPVEWKKKFPLACELPSNLAGYSIVVAEDATIAAQTVKKAVAVGRDFGDTTSDTPSVVGGSQGAGASHVKGVTKGNWNFKTTLCDEGNADAIPFDWNRFKYIAANAQPSNYAMDENRVFVIEQGGVYDSTGTGKLMRYSMDDLLVDGKMLDASDSGKTLVVFRDEGTVVLEAASNGQSWTPSVLAPKAHVILDDSVGSIGGFLVARSLGDRGPKTHTLELKGDGYAGAVLCPAEENECDPYPVEWDGSCDLPSNLGGYSIVVADDAILGGTTISKAVAVGRDFGDALSAATATVGSSGGSDKSYLNGVTKGFWNFQTVICDQGDMKVTPTPTPTPTPTLQPNPNTDPKP